MRRTHDAVMVGSTTATMDDPGLTCRLPGLETSPPLRIVLDGRLQTPLTAQVVRTARAVPTLLITRADTDPVRRRAFADCGVELLEIDHDTEGNIDLSAAFAGLGARGLTRVLVEGGSRLAAALIRAGLIDRIEWFRSAAVMGGDGLPAVQGFGVEHLADLRRLARTALRVAGSDVLETFAVVN
jgi:diaminohydroxyphosphoribosylaminopyrimidine deaminase/5-amino-6-(5-phosphoribosylamino)uracil reductase